MTRPILFLLALYAYLAIAAQFGLGDVARYL